METSMIQISSLATIKYPHTHTHTHTHTQNNDVLS